MSFNESPDGRRPTFTPTLALRVGIVGTVVLALFAIVFFRLWFLQVLTGHQYVLTASHNQQRTVALTPPRGEILASDGQPLVTSTTALALQIDPTELPVKVNQSNIFEHYRRDDAVYSRLAHLLHDKTKPKPCKVATPPPSCNVAAGHCPHSTTRRLGPIACKVAQSIALNFYADVTVKQPVHQQLQYYIAERSNRYRGVEVEQTSVPGYPFGDVAAQALGAVGRLNTAEQKLHTFKGVNPNAVVGQSGLEYEYDQYLRGTFGKQRIKVDSSGVAVGEGRTVQPEAGENLRTTLNLKLQQVGQSSLQQAINDNGGLGGAFVAMNPDTGGIYGMGSLPSYNPKIFTQPVIPTKQYQRVFGAGSGDPQFNRATQSQAPNGSTFKVITSTAALQSGLWSVDDTYDDNGSYCPPGVPAGSSQCKQNAGGAAYGDLGLTDAIKVSDDVFFYHLGALLNVDQPKGGSLQKWAKLFGVGQNPHIDLPGAKSGILPSPAWYARRVRLEEQCETATGVYRYTNGKGGISATPKPGYHPSPKHLFDAATGAGGCGISTPGTEWTVGQNVNMAVGQGDVEVSPLQLAMVYSAIENGGTIVRPHLGDAVQNADGTQLQKLSFPAQRHLDIAPGNLSAIQEGLHEAAQSPGGTSDDVMGSFGLPVYGKTGTAQYIPTSGPRAGVESDYAWYACYVPASATSKPIVIVVWVEGGGFGDVASAPVARQILGQWFYDKPGTYHSGTSIDK